MKRVRIILSICWGCCLAPLALSAQTTYQVITKKVERSFPYQDGHEVNIEGEKAEVAIKTWNRDEIAITLVLRAKHPDEARAARDLEAMQYRVERVKNKVYVRNFLRVPEGKASPEALLEVSYAIRVPEDCPVYLKNHFGAASVSDLAAGLRVNSEFTKLGLDNIRGLIDVRTRFGDLEGSRLDGAVTINARRSNVTLREIKGQYDITAQYGILKIFADRHLIDLKIDADKSEVLLYNPDRSAFAYNIQAQSSDLSLPNELPFKFSDNNLALKKASFQPEQEYFANITITIRFGELVIK